MSSIRLKPFQLLELNVISGQDLAKVARNMRTYAVAWVHPDRKLSTRVDTVGHNNPTWNDKFVFRVDDHFLYGDTSAVMIEIYALSWFRDIHVGTVRVIVGNLIPPPNPRTHHVGMRFVALQVRRRLSGRPQGILNIGVAILDNSMRSMPLYTQLSASAVGYRQMMDEGEFYHHRAPNSPPQGSQSSYIVPWIPKPELRRTKSDSSSLIVPVEAAAEKKTKKEKARSEVSGSSVFTKRNRGAKVGSAVNINGSLLYGSLAKGKYGSQLDFPHSVIDVGPSASEVAAMNRHRGYSDVEESEIVGEWSYGDSMDGLHTKLERWRAEIPIPNMGLERDGYSSIVTSDKRSRTRERRSKSEDAFSCFSNICGLQCSIVCGGDSSSKQQRPKGSSSTYSMTTI